MRSSIFWFTALLFHAGAAPVSITNFNMESAPTAQADGGLTASLATGWTFANISGSPGTFTFNTATSTRYYNDAAFADTSPSGGANGTMAGPNFTGLSGTGSGYIQQTLTATVAASTQYTLNVALGHRTVDSGAAATASPVTIELRSGAVSLASVTVDPSGGIWSDTGALPDDIWADATLVFTTAATPAQLGQPLTIRLTKSGASGNYMDIDNVRLDAVATTPPVTVNLAAGLTGFFPFEQDFSNRSGWADGIAVNGAVAGQAGGVSGNAMELRAGGGSSNDCMRVPIGYGGTAAGDNLGANFTISAWYNLDAPPAGSSSGRYFVYEGLGNTGNGFDLSYGLRDLGLGTAGVNDGQAFTDTTTTSPSGTGAGFNSLNLADAGLAGWHHVLQTYFSSGGVTTIRTYIDGVEAASLTPQTSAIVDGGIHIGAARTGVMDRGFDGKIDEVAMWSRVLNSDEITAVRNKGLAGEPVVVAPVIAQFQASETSVAPGGQVTLSWSVSNAQTVSISPGIGTVSATGSTLVTVPATTSYLLTATAANGDVDQKQLTVTASRGPISVYLLGGQSNMQGVGRKSVLPALGLAEIPEVLLYHSSGTQSTAGANTLTTVRACGVDSISFGPEIGFADEMRTLHPGTSMCLIKHAVGGTSLQVKWNPGANNSDSANFGVEYATFVSTVNAGMAALRQQGYEPKIAGMIWQQGEQDSKEGLLTSGDGNSQSANQYGDNLKHLVARVREQFAADLASSGLRFVLGQVTPYYPAGGTLSVAYPARDKIRQAQLNADETSGSALSIANTATVPTNDVDFPVHEQVVDGYLDTDEAHFAEAALLLLGRGMAMRMTPLNPSDYAAWALSHQVTGSADADDDHDGVTNLFEFAAGTLPDNTASQSRPSMAVENISGIGNCLTLTIRTDLNALMTGSEVQVSSDLIQWNQGVAPVFMGAEYVSPGVVDRKFRAPQSTSTPPGRQFMRLLLTP